MKKGKSKATSKVGGLCSWDSSIHDSSCLNRITASSERAYLIVKVTTTTTSTTTTTTTMKTWSSSTGGGQVEPPSNYGSGPEEENMLHSRQKALAGWETEKEVGTGNSFWISWFEEVLWKGASVFAFRLLLCGLSVSVTKSSQMCQRLFTFLKLCNCTHVWNADHVHTESD